MIISRRNDCPNPALTNGSAGCFSGTRVATDVPSPDGVVRGHAYRVATGTAAVLPEVTASAGQRRNHAVYARANDGTGTARIQVQSYAGGTFLGSTQSPTAHALPAGEWVRIDQDQVTATGTTRARTLVAVAGSAGTTVDLALFLFEGGDALDDLPAVPGPYFDGDSPYSAWVGTVGSSPSTSYLAVATPPDPGVYTPAGWVDTVPRTAVVPGMPDTGWSVTGDDVLAASVEDVRDHPTASRALTVRGTGLVRITLPRVGDDYTGRTARRLRFDVQGNGHQLVKLEEFRLLIDGTRGGAGQPGNPTDLRVAAPTDVESGRWQPLHFAHGVDFQSPHWYTATLVVDLGEGGALRVTGATVDSVSPQDTTPPPTNPNPNPDPVPTSPHPQGRPLLPSGSLSPNPSLTDTADGWARDAFHSAAVDGGRVASVGHLYTPWAYEIGRTDGDYYGEGRIALPPVRIDDPERLLFGLGVDFRVLPDQSRPVTAVLVVRVHTLTGTLVYEGGGGSAYDVQSSQQWTALENSRIDVGRWVGEPVIVSSFVNFTWLDTEHAVQVTQHQVYRA